MSLYTHMAGASLAALLWLSPAPATAAVVFMYHHFGVSDYPSTNVRLAQFEAHLEHLETAGYRVWALERIVERLRSGEPIPDRTVAITVDDAYASVYTEAYPRLRRRGWPFTVFVATDSVDRGLEAYMTWEQMREMQRHGARFANHSASHDYLIHLRPGEDAARWRARVREDIQRAQRRLEEELGEAPLLFAYPYGEYHTALADLVSGLGYVAFGQHSGAIGGLDDLRALPRFPMAEQFADLGEFRTKAATLPLRVRTVEPWDPVVRDGGAPVMEVTLDGARPERLSCFASHTGPIAVRWSGDDGAVFTTRADRPLPVGRSRYNCTAPAAQDGRHHWFSHLWIRLSEDVRTLPARSD